MEIEEWVEGTIRVYKERLTHFVSEGKSEQEFLEEQLKMLKTIEYFNKNNLSQNVENILDTKCEIHYNVYSIRTELKS
jgi:hypothetical protein